MKPIDPELEGLVKRVIGAAIDVHRALGPGLKESVYSNALALEFEMLGFSYQREYSFDVVYRDEVVGSGRIDFLIEGVLVLEMKAVSEVLDVHKAQTRSYLWHVGRPLGLLLNFRVDYLKNGIHRIIDSRLG
ncbi:MAG: GxxExxY protein [Planctomycetes bacterium]|nr:GxxExxY protein [Planctomycetota bacterium]